MDRASAGRARREHAGAEVRQGLGAEGGPPGHDVQVSQWDTVRQIRTESWVRHLIVSVGFAPATADSSSEVSTARVSLLSVRVRFDKGDSSTRGTWEFCGG